jgi:GNAT superfamily N-acetyltransferase
MAWDEWAPKIEYLPRSRFNNFTCKGKECGYNDSVGGYAIKHDNGKNSNLTFMHSVDRNYDPVLAIGAVWTDPEYRQDGVAEALMRKLVEDHPGVPIKPGLLLPDGQKFHDRMLEKEPRAKDLVTAQRLAMAWEDYKDKIQGGCRSCTDGWEGRYTVPQAGAFLNYTHGNHLGKPAVHVQGIYTHPSNRNDGVAEALMRRLAEDHPGVPINPGYMTPDGQNFHDKMLEKEPTARELVTARRRFLAMAWDEWAPQIQNTYGGCEPGQCRQAHPTENSSTYHIKHDDGDHSYLRYSHEEGPGGEPTLSIRQIYTNEGHRKDGLAEALMRRLHEDHPGFKIDPGRMTQYGQGFHDRMLEKEPAARDLVTAAMQVLAMAKRLGPGYYEHQTDHGKFQITQVNNPAYSGSSWYLHYPSEHDPHNEASEHPDDVFRTKRDALAVANEWKGRE